MEDVGPMIVWLTQPEQGEKDTGRSFSSACVRGEANYSLEDLNDGIRETAELSKGIKRGS